MKQCWEFAEPWSLPIQIVVLRFVYIHFLLPDTKCAPMCCYVCVNPLLCSISTFILDSAVCVTHLDTFIYHCFRLVPSKSRDSQWQTHPETYTASWQCVLVYTCTGRLSYNVSCFTQNVDMSMKCCNTLSVAACSALNKSECCTSVVYSQDGGEAQVNLHHDQLTPSVGHVALVQHSLPPTLHHNR